MAASPLAEIDWDNLTSGGYSLVTALNLLEKMFAERMNVPTLINCASTNTSLVEIDRFPFLSNSPDYGLLTWPATFGPPISALGGVGRIGRCYLSETKIADLLGGTTYSLFAPVVDDATIFSDHGITEYPALEIISAVEIKKWYDILSSLKWIYSGHSFDNGGSGTFYNSGYRSGQIETPTNGGIFYGALDPNPLSQYDTDAALVWTGPTSKSVTNTTGSGIGYYRVSYNGTGPVGNATRINAATAKGFNRYDLSTFVASGHAGSPQGFRAYGHMSVNGSTFGGGGSGPLEDYRDAFEFQNSIVYEFSNPTRTNITGNIFEYEITFNTPPPIPNITGGFSATFNSGGCSTFDLWDQEGGFEFYTP